jgi:hypothetical protein
VDVRILHASANELDAAHHMKPLDSPPLKQHVRDKDKTSPPFINTIRRKLFTYSVQYARCIVKYVFADQMELSISRIPGRLFAIISLPLF